MKTLLLVLIDNPFELTKCSPKKICLRLMTNAGIGPHENNRESCFWDQRP